jgi:hypothetical protein
MRASCFVVLVMFNILSPKLAPDLDKSPFTNVELNEYQRLRIVFEVEIREVIVRETFFRVVTNAEYIIRITFILQNTADHYLT